MSGLIFIVFLGFALFYRLGLSYYRLLLIALLCQFVAFKFTALHPLVIWSFEWAAPIALMTFATLKEEELSIGIKSLFFLGSISLMLVGVWDYQSLQDLKSLVSQPSESSKENWKVFPGLPLEQTLKQENADDPRRASDEWEEIVSTEGKFKVLSPLPVATKKEIRKVHNNELLITQTHIKDLTEEVYYAVLTTHYPEGFNLPTPQIQTQVALQHLASTYAYDEVIEMKAIEHESLEGIGFHLKRKESKEHLIGLILPSCQSILYQAIVFTNGEEKSNQLAEKFLLSFKPLPCEPKNPH